QLASGASQDAQAVALTLSGVSVFLGTGGSLNAHGTPTDYSDDTVDNGTLGFGATVATLTLVAIKDSGATAATSDDTNYLGIALDNFAGDLIGLDDLLAFHAFGVDALVNRATLGVGGVGTPAKLDWSAFAN